MNKKDKETLKRKLEENKKSLEENLEKFAKKDTLPEGDWDTVFPSVEGSSMEEKADEVEEYSSLLKIEEALEVKLKNIDDALKRMEDNSYGNCEKCDKEISYEKLSIIPETRTCKKCT